MQEYFGDSIFLARDGDDLVGYVLGFRSQVDSSVFYLWQIGVIKEHRGTGLAQRLVSALLGKASEMGAKRMHVTAEIDNIASWKLFLKMGFENISSGETVEKYGQKAMVNYYGSGTDQVFMEKLITD
mgnify:FL=1